MSEICQLGPFLLDSQIGRGGMGTVYRGRHRETDVDVAIKIIRRDVDSGARRRFHREVQAHAALMHPGVVFLFEYGEVPQRTAASNAEFEAGSPYVAMELADCGTTREELPYSSWRVVRGVLLEVLGALAYAHAREVLHRDLKPENFLVFERGERQRRIKLADFGIAHILGRTSSASRTSCEQFTASAARGPEKGCRGWCAARYGGRSSTAATSTSTCFSASRSRRRTTRDARSTPGP